MKTSFYFVLWIGLYLIIEFFGGHWINENAFIIAFIAVIVISGLVNKLTAESQKEMNRRNIDAFFEIVYQNDFKKYLAIYRRTFWFNAATFVYFLITVAFLLLVRENLFITFIFAFFGYGAAKSMSKSYTRYSEIKANGSIELDAETMEAYNKYKEARESGQVINILYRPTTTGYKVLQGCNYLFAVLAVIIGLYYICVFIPGLLTSGAMLMGSAMLVAYGGLSLIYGIHDFVTTFQGYNIDIH